MNKIPYIKTTFLILFFLGNSFSSKAQHKAYLIGQGESKLVKLEEAAAYAFKNRDYYSAYRFYKDALSIDSLKVTNRYGLAKSAEKYGAFCVAGDAYDRVVAADTTAELAFPIAKLKAGEMKKLSGDVDQADIILMDLKEVETDNEELNRQLADLKFIETAWGEETSNNQPPPVNLGPIINTEFAEFSPVWRNGALYYGSLAYTKKKDSVRPRREFSKILRTKLNGQTEEWESMNIVDKSVGHLSFTPSDSRMYFTICDYTDKSSNLICQLYYKDKIGEGVNSWGTTKPLPESVNNPNFTNTQPAVGLNEKGEEVLYFVSNRPTPESMGGMDIWYTKINEDNTFSPPINLGDQVNTSRNDITPFYHFPTETLYFSSNGYQGFGGYDINKTAINTAGEWGEIENLKEPFNSSHHDFNFFLKEAGNEAFFVSGREGCEVEQGCHDIFRIDIPEPLSKTEVLVNLFDAETKLPLSGGGVVVKELDLIGTLQEEGGNRFTFPSDVLEGAVILEGAHRDYLTNTISVNIEKYTENVFDIYLPYQPTLAVKVLTRNADNLSEVAVNGATVELVFLDNEGSIPKTQEPNIFDFLVDLQANYQVKVSHPLYNSKTIEFTITENKEEKIVYLELEKEEESEIIYETLVTCYFDHDRPRKAAIDASYNDLHATYIREERQQRYRDRFMAGEDANGRIENKRLVDDFFDNKVDPSLDVLESFRVDLLEKLKVLPDGENYIVTIKGFTSNVGTSTYNDDLAQRRINSVRNYFTITHYGAFQEFLTVKRNLYFEEEPLGEVGAGFENPTDYKNTIYNPESASKRRVEILRKISNKSNSIGESEER